MEEFIHRENLIIFKRRLAEAKNDAQRQMLLKLLAEEEAKGGRSQPGAPSRLNQERPAQPKELRSSGGNREAASRRVCVGKMSS